MKKRVLVVDGDMHNGLETAGTLLEKKRYSPFWVESYGKALEVLELAKHQSAPFVAIITEWRLPDKDGIELAKTVKTSKDESLSRLLVVMYTDKGNITLLEAEHAGVSAVFMKPDATQVDELPKLIDFLNEKL